MNTSQRNTIYIVFLLIFTALAIYNLILGSQWFIDSVISVFLLSLAVFVNKWVKAKASELIMFSIIMIIHDLGSFGFYNFKIILFTKPLNSPIIFSLILSVVCFAMPEIIVGEKGIVAVLIIIGLDNYMPCYIIEYPVIYFYCPTAYN